VKEKLPPKFRGLDRCWVVKVCEGEGIRGDPSRLVFYVYTESGCPLGRIDGLESFEQAKGGKP